MVAIIVINVQKLRIPEKSGRWLGVGIGPGFILF